MLVKEGLSNVLYSKVSQGVIGIVQMAYYWGWMSRSSSYVAKLANWRGDLHF